MIDDSDRFVTIGLQAFDQQFVHRPTPASPRMHLVDG
ncbi:unnamed protein product, partial [marine sediment metagenome]